MHTMQQEKLQKLIHEKNKKDCISLFRWIGYFCHIKVLQDKYKAEVICYTSDLGQEINRKAIYTNAKKLGVKKIIIEDLKEKICKRLCVSNDKR